MIDDPRCTSCGKLFTEHLGLIGTCELLQKAMKEYRFPEGVDLCACCPYRSATNKVKCEKCPLEENNRKEIEG